MMIRHTKKHEKQKRWETWFRTQIYADHGTHSYGPRHLVIRDFVRRGLFPFVRAKGYVFSGDIEKVTISLLRYMFALHEGDKVIFKNPHSKFVQDHVNEFEHRFDSMELEEFWKRWNCIEDFQEYRYAHELHYTLTNFLWPSIDLERSPIFLQIEKALDEIEEWEEIQFARKEHKGRDDPYLHDSSKVNYEDRHWH